MSREVPALSVNEGFVQASIEQEATVPTEEFSQCNLSAADAALEDNAECSTDILDRAIQLQPKAKIALIRKLITQLETDQIQTVLEFGLREIGDRHRRRLPSASSSHHTRLLLKKDYSYQERGLSQPNQYYVYLRRRKPKLDRYIGTLFYVPEGCTLSYFLDAEGRIVFNPPHNIFRLKDCKNPEIAQVVRLLYLEPPPPEYTFTKQQNDTPEIYLHLEYLDINSYHPIAKQTYPFPTCMYEGGALDRYRWEVSTIALPSELAPDFDLKLPTPATPYPLPSELSTFSSSGQQTALPERIPELAIRSADIPATTASPPQRQVLELPATKPSTFFLQNASDPDLILKRMRLWVGWSEKAMPQSRWEIVQDGATYTLMNAHFKRRILSFSRERSTVTLENSLPVVVKWFHDLSLAVSQAQNQRQYSTAQLKLAHSLFVDMSLPQKDPIVVLRKLFGTEFCKNMQ